jgi:hypothetical protein
MPVSQNSLKPKAWANDRRLSFRAGSRLFQQAARPTKRRNRAMEKAGKQPMLPILPCPGCRGTYRELAVL